MSMLLVAIVFASGVLASTPRSEAEVKALWVINLSRFIEWPESTKDSLVISVIDDDEMAEHLRAFQQQSSKGKQIKILSFDQFNRQSELKYSNILFIGNASDKTHGEVLKFAKGFNVFTISDSPSFVDQGGIMSLNINEGAINYSLNRRAAISENINIGSALLGRATRIIDAPQ